MNEEEREIVKKFERLYLKDFNNEKIINEDRLSYIECVLMSNLIEKLQKENEKLKNKLLDTLEGQKVIKEETPQYIKENYISKQEVKDKIEKLNKKEQKLQNSISAEEREEYSDANISWDLMDINIKREVLQELIEKSE